MTFYQWLCFLGVDAIIAAVIGWVVAMIRKDRADRKAMKAGLQAILRAMMIAEYNKWEERDFAPIYARQNFENCWEQYHALGANGVMDDIHKKFLQLPTEKPQTRRN
jgi:hypothetical protein